MTRSEPACPGAVCHPLKGTVEDVLSREWLITNGLGGFASGTVIGCPTRKYHGLLVASRHPPLERFLTLVGLADRVGGGNERLALSTWEFNHGFEPAGYQHLRDFEYSLSSPNPWVQWTYASAGTEVRRRVTLVTHRPMLRIRYDITASPGRELVLEMSPMLAMRDLHDLRRQAAMETWDTQSDGHGLWAQDRHPGGATLAVFPSTGEGLAPARFDVEAVWWHNVRYREEAAREYLGGEDLQRAGTFRCEGSGSLSVEFVAVGFATSLAEAIQTAGSAITRHHHVPAPAPAGKGSVRHALTVAADQFVVRRSSPGLDDQATIIAGYPWFGDWGRDSFVSLEGLLLRTGRYDAARQVLQTFARSQHNGLIPNRFDDGGGECEYNSVDASLWYVHAADAYLSTVDDPAAWAEVLAPTCRRIAEAFVAGTDFNIGIDESGLVHCGHPAIQITWMDAKCGDVVFTPRHGRPVEVNALWYHALRILERRFQGDDGSTASRCRLLADRVERNFESVFWNDKLRCLYDCVGEDGSDASIRPNQIFAVSLAHSPLPPDKQAAVVQMVTEHLLTPFGLRSLAPSDRRYRGTYGGVQMQRDAAYHNGTVWAWLIGPYIEAYLRVHGETPAAKRHARGLLQPLLDHMAEAGMGSISEIFDGDEPHTPRGCFAQAWSVAEVLRMLDKLEGP